MSPNVSSSHPVGAFASSHLVKVSLMDERNGPVFTLTFRGETIRLEGSWSLNRWSATGIVRRHNVSVSSESLTIDGRAVRFDDPNSIQELERIFNETHAPTPTPSKPVKHTEAANHPLPAEDSSFMSKFADTVHVTRDGFEFHVNYLTKFGQHKVEQLEKALETFQQMRAFKPHVNVQKTGIRMAVTSWDGERFLEEPGIENLEHATPQEVEALLKRNLEGTSDTGATLQSSREAVAVREVTALHLARKAHDLRFHMMLQRSDGTVEEGPLMIRANLPKFQNLFRPDLNVLMTAMNDRVIIERTEEVDGKQAKRTDLFDFKTDDDAKKLEEALNRCLKVSQTLR